MNSRKTAIIGTGMIASSMAVLCAGHGMEAFVFVRSESSKERCRSFIKDAFAQMKNHGLISDEQIVICMRYVHFVSSYEELSEAEIAFECIVENVDEKHSVYRTLEANCPKLRAICSVSSSIIPDVLAEGIEKYGDRIIVTHPFNPAHMVPYFELCGSSKTADGVIDFAVGVLEELDRKPVVLKKPTPGFIGNRLQFALLREAISLVEKGIADPRDIDTCLQYSFTPRYTSIGIFEHFDNGGMQLCSTVCDNLFPLLSDEKQTPKTIRDLMEKGEMGARSGKGFYDWHDVDWNAYNERVSEPYWRFCKWNYPAE